MIVSLSGIIVLQLYWINGAIKVREKQFDGQVLDALNDVTGKLQLHEAMVVLPKILQGLDSGQRKTVDSLFNRRIVQRHHHNFGLHPKKRFGPVADNPFRPEKQDSGLEPRNHLTPLEMPEKTGTSNGISDSMLLDSAHRLFAKANVYGQALRRMIMNYAALNSDMQKRLSKKLIDSVLKTELKKRGIDIQYESAVLNTRDHRLDFVSQNADTAKLRCSVYKAALFPDDLKPQPNFLTIYFTGKQIFVLKSIGVVLPGSFLFMLIIIISCGYTIYTLLRQKKLSEMKNDFINNMTHEFKTPIATISLAADAIMDTRVIGDKKKLGRYALMIKEENNRMNLQVQNVLNAAIMDKGDFKINMVPFDAKECIEKLVDRFRLQILERNGKLNWKPDAADYIILGDPTHFENVINNLLDNANKYSSDAPVVDVRAYNEAGVLVIEVEDHGSGMSRETQKKIFEKFYRLSTGNLHDIKGFGLGLSYAKEVVLAFKGTMEVKSELKKGSVFAIRLPLYNETDSNMR